MSSALRQVPPEPAEWVLTDTPTVFSKFGGTLSQFMQQLHWGAGDEVSGLHRERDRRRANGDQVLLARLGAVLGTTQAVSSLTEGELDDIVDDVEMALLGERWQLVGDETEPLMDRLDRHFKVPQDAWTANQVERRQAAANLERQRAQRRLDAIRGEILEGRAILENTGERLKQLDGMLAEQAAELGVKPWGQ